MSDLLYFYKLCACILKTRRIVPRQVLGMNTNLKFVILNMFSETLGFLLSQELTEEPSRASFNDSKFLSSNGEPKELFLSSDASALVEHTKKVLVIEDGEVVHVKVYHCITGYDILYS